MIRVGLVGVGFMGWIHYLAYQKVRSMKLAAVSSRDPKRLKGDWRGIKGNFGPPGEKIDLSGVAGYSTYDELLADESIDMVDLCLPPAIHAEYTIKAFEAGKHVLVEKPIAVTVADAKKMVKASQKTGKMLLTAHSLPFFPEYSFALKAARSGKYGKVLGGSFKRTISDPTWVDGFWDAEKVGGPMVDLQIHDSHWIRLLFGMPTAVTSQGRMRGDVVEYVSSQFEFADKSLVVNLNAGVIDQPTRSFAHGFEIHFEEATMLFDFCVIDDQPVLSMPLTVIPKKGKSKQPKLAGGDPVEAFIAEMKEAASSIESGTPSEILSGEVAADALLLCYKQTEAVVKGRKVKV